MSGLGSSRTLPQSLQNSVSFFEAGKPNLRSFDSGLGNFEKWTDFLRTSPGNSCFRAGAAGFGTTGTIRGFAISGTGSSPKIRCAGRGGCNLSQSGQYGTGSKK